MQDQTNKADGGKTNPLLLHDDLGLALRLVNRVLDYGAEKYERAGWKKVDSERYEAAALRHRSDRRLLGEEYDAESDLLHLAHEACNVLFLLQMKIEQSERSVKRLMTYKKPPQSHKSPIQINTVMQNERARVENQIANTP